MSVLDAPQNDRTIQDRPGDSSALVEIARMALSETVGRVSDVHVDLARASIDVETTNGETSDSDTRLKDVIEWYRSQQRKGDGRWLSAGPAARAHRPHRPGRGGPGMRL